MAKKKPGKYADVLPKLPKLPLFDAERSAVIDAIKVEIVAPPSDLDAPVFDSELDFQLSEMRAAFRRLLQIHLRSTAGKPWASEYAREYAELRALKDTLGAMESNVNVLLDAYTSLMIDQFEVEGVSSLTLANGQPVSTYPEPYAQVTDKEAFRLWCIANGLEKSLQLWPSTMNSLTKKMLIDGLPEPDGVTAYAKTRIRLGSE